MERTIKIDYNWWFSANEKRSIPKRFADELDAAAKQRIFEQIQDGWCREGELNETLHDGRKPVEFRGWWKVTMEDTF